MQQFRILVPLEWYQYALFFRVLLKGTQCHIFWCVIVSKQILDLSVHNEVESPFLLNQSRRVLHRVRHRSSIVRNIRPDPIMSSGVSCLRVPVVLPLLHIPAVKLSYCMSSRSSPVYWTILCLSRISGAISANVQGYHAVSIIIKVLVAPLTWHQIT